LIISADTLTAGATLSADLAVVGAGPAGIVTALEVASKGLDVLLVESGYEEFDSHVQQLAEAGELNSSVHAPMSFAIRRQLGGTSVIWGGRCVPFDPVDFDRRQFIGEAAWPIAYEQIQPYFQRACDWLRCGRAIFDATQIRHLRRALVPGLRDGEMLTSSLERWSLPTNFGREYRQMLRLSARVRVITGLTCTEVICRSGETWVDYLECRGIGGKPIRIRCRGYVVARSKRWATWRPIWASGLVVYGPPRGGRRKCAILYSSSGDCLWLRTRRGRHLRATETVN